MVSGFFSIMGNLDWCMPNIVPRLPLYKRAVETCCGRGELVWHTKMPEEEIMNDKDPSILRMYRFVQNTPFGELEKFRRRHDWVLTKKTFQKLKYSTPQTEEDFFFRRLYLYRGSKRDSEVDKCHFLINLEGEKFNSVNRIKKIKSRLRNVKFTNLDAVDCVERFDSPDTFFFIDPPYPSRERYYTVSNLNWRKFYETLQSVKGKWMMVYDPVIKTRIKHISGRRKYYAIKCHKIGMKMIEENNHILLEQPFLMKGMWKKNNKFQEFKKYYVVCNYKIPEKAPKPKDSALSW